MAVCCLDDAGAWAHELVECGIAVTALQRGPGFQPRLGRRVLRRGAAARRHGPARAPLLAVRLQLPGQARASVAARRLHRARPAVGRAAVGEAAAGESGLSPLLARGVRRVSEDVKAHLVGEGFGARQVGVIYNGIDVGPLPDRGPARGDSPRGSAVGDAEFVIGTIARLDPVKDLGTLLRATATLVRRDQRDARRGRRRPRAARAGGAGTANWASRRASGFSASGTTRATGWRAATST